MWRKVKVADKPRVLVLMTTCNGQAYLNQQLKSILGQRGVEVTLRVSDDCSTDNTYRILETFASEHSNIELRYNAQNKGVIRNFMDLVYTAEADDFDYFAFADQDDVWHANKLIVASQHISSNTSRPELYYADVRNIDEHGRTLGFEYQPYEVCAEHPASLLLVQNWCLGCTTLMNGALVKLLRAHPVYDFGRMYDAWVHAVCLYCGGYVYHDLGHHYVNRRITGHNTVGLMNVERTRGFVAKKALGWLAHGNPEVSQKHTKMASALLREYHDDMLPETARLVEDVAKRQESFPARVRLWRNKDIVMPTKLRTRWLRWMVLFNRF